MKQFQQTIGICFFVRKNKEKNDRWPVYARITVNNLRCDFSIKESVSIRGWDDKHGRAKNTLPEYRMLNTYLEEVRNKIMSHYKELITSNKTITADILKRKYFGLDNQTRNLMELIEYHNIQMVGKLAEGTLKNYRSTARYVVKFLKEIKRRTDLELSELDYRFILEFEQFVRSTPLKSFDPCNNNGLMKHMERLRKIGGLGVKLGWMSKNPFENYRTSFQRYDRQFLTDSELMSIEFCTLHDSTLSLTRDLFVFSCYTGLAPIDLTNLTNGNIIEGSDGELWLHTERAKTGTVVDVPLLPKAVALIGKYRERPVTLRTGSLFPILTNQQMNRSLKIISEICQINKYLTFYLSRHTFATTVTLNNGVPLETISKMLGHTKFSTTQIYARVLNKKIGADMSALKMRLSEKANPT